MEVNIVEGILSDFQADVIVNSTNPALMLDLGGLSQSLSRKAGPDLQKECSQSYPNGISFGEVVSTNGYGLHCQKVYHVSVCAWDSEFADAQWILNEVTTGCLRKAHEDGMTSIAFPTLGCGFLSHPPDIVANIMKQCIEQFEESFPVTTLKQVFVVVFTKPRGWEHVLQAFHLVFENKEDRAVTTMDARPSLNKPYSLTSDFSQTCIREMKNNSCVKVLFCGHQCAGYRDEPQCPPCMDKDCIHKGHGQTGDDNCAVCYTDPLRAAPCILLNCGHKYHLHCVKRILENKWVGPRITFNFILCPMCKQPMDHPELQSLLNPIHELNEEVKRKALTRLQYEGLEKSDQITNSASPYYNNPAQFAMDRYCYYTCFKCNRPFFGGAAQCEDGAGDVNLKPEELICSACSGVQGVQNCNIHGTDFIEYKCRYCCTVAVFYCFGNTHFCNECHNDNIRVAGMGDNLPKCPAGPCGKQLTEDCPLGIEHAPNGTEFCLGCGLCSNLQSF
ncbi:E3 ubiquitin-protein ligase MYCBP2-like [Ruditapes philippinarum]|uniref:E3 ubiquitin-protein ligase MYCBP2-like n=1 Tax=Ruditapes philippinarum TaxID=129788 RepID=UPI00295BC0D5|nr:E3 ubiquitin-protein ligase MYCBP2-like [Ruditapes philippinarum]